MNGERELTHGSIALSCDIDGFFRQVLSAAIEAHGCETTEAAECYLVGLLADYAKPDQLSSDTLQRPITFLMQDALRCSGPERFTRLRALGDGVLYVTSFFRDHLERRGVQLNYVRKLGARAYSDVSAMLHPAHTAGKDETSRVDVFRELSENFQGYADVLNHVADRLLASSSRSASSTVKLYERWLKTGSRALAEALAEHGLIPLRGNDAVN